MALIDIVACWLVFKLGDAVDEKAIKWFGSLVGQVITFVAFKMSSGKPTLVLCSLSHPNHTSIQ